MPQFDTMEQLADWLDSAPEGLPVVDKDRRERAECSAPHYHIVAQVAGCRVTMYAHPADADGLRDRARRLRGTLRRVGSGETKRAARTSHVAPRTLEQSNRKQRAALAHQLLKDGDDYGAYCLARDAGAGYTFAHGKNSAAVFVLGEQIEPDIVLGQYLNGWAVVDAVSGTALVFAPEKGQAKAHYDAYKLSQWSTPLERHREARTGAHLEALYELESYA